MGAAGASATALAAVSAGITAISAISGYQSQKDNAEAQERGVQLQRDADRMEAERAQQATQEQSAAEANAHAASARKTMARFDAIAAENGGGVSSQRASAALGIQQGQDMATLGSNARKVSADIGFGDLAAGTRAQARMDSIRQPSLLEAGLTIAGAGIKYSTTMEDIRTRKG